MQRSLLLLLGLCGLVASRLGADNALDKEVFGRVAEQMRLNLARLPNYTCVETVERSRRSSQSASFELVDRVRLEIAIVNGKEMFSWPGAGNFEDKDIDDLMLGGAFGNGNFGMLARALFLTNAANFMVAGERIYDGRRTWRWDFTVPRFRGVYEIGNRKRKGVAGLRGSFWADAETHHIVRIETKAEEIPAELEIVSSENSIDYAHVTIGGAEFLLPKSAELRMRDYGGEWRNVISLSGCRQYLGESKISYGDPQPEAALKTAGGADQELVNIPGNMYLQLRLKNDLRAETAAIGDPLAAELLNDVKANGTVLVRRRAEVRGRVMSLRLQRGNMKYHVVGIGFDEFITGKERGRLRAKLLEVRVAGNIISTNPLELRRFGGGRVGGWIEHEQIVAPGVLFVSPGRLLLPAGMQMVWRTESVLFGDSE
ncbi:MAG TPA: hypothetical protein VFL57_06795 [Bryobacteraceae bacterium]|nr:hypothetical protein [Bryobacteraceae bacterium]